MIIYFFKKYKMDNPTSPLFVIDNFPFSYFVATELSQASSFTARAILFAQ